MQAALFPGQGSQSIGMGRFLFEEFKLARLAFEEASDCLSTNFQKLCFEGPESDLHLTENTQPVLLLVSTATFRVLEDLTGFKPGAAAGHSIGEYAACVTAGVFNFADGIKAVRRRGQAMQQAVPVGQGAMLAAMGLSDEQAKKVCKIVEEKSGFKPLECANFNSPGQIVLSGSAQAVAWLRANFDLAWLAPEPSRVKFIPLNVSAPFHCSLMKPAEETMRKVLSDISFQDAKWPIVQNFTATPIQKAEEIRENLARQISGSVRWTECYLKLKMLGMSAAVEFGSGKVLSGLAKKIDSTIPVPLNINSLDDVRAAEKILKG